MRNLKLYKASAGSGKTYQLALTYIQGLFKDPSAYKKILAVTFTNKAAGEMKFRILEKLYQLSQGSREANDYAQKLIEEGLANSPESVKQKAESLLLSILHDYSDLYILTIDKFFQFIIRGFTREIGLQNRYNLELDSERILVEAVDRLILDIDEDKQLREWLLLFAGNKVSQGKSWDINHDIITLGEEVFRESYQMVQSGETGEEENQEKILRLFKHLNSSISSFESSLREKSDEALTILQENGLKVDDFKYRDKGVLSLFLKIHNDSIESIKIGSRVRDGMDDFENWVSKKSDKREDIKRVYDNALRDLLSDVLAMWDEGSQKYYTALAIKRNIYIFGLLNDISDRIREISKEKNLFLISDSALFIKKIIGTNQAPFIYEKAGNYFSSFMLDEFQDTSRFQWENFLPLIENGLAEGVNSIVVGDVKQSIYRWRNSDWKILAAELSQAIHPERIELFPLNTNYRSSENLIRYNNTVFYSAPKVLLEIIRGQLQNKEFSGMISYWEDLMGTVYGEPRQNFIGQENQPAGYVFHQFAEPKKGGEYYLFAGNWVKNKVKELQDRGYRARDITILVRKGMEGREIARLLSEENDSSDSRYNFNVISNDSLYLLKNPTVRFLLALLRYFNYSGHVLNTSYIKHEYFAFLSENTDEFFDWHLIFAEKELATDACIKEKRFSGFIDQIPFLRQLPLYELVERLIHIFGLTHNASQIAYIQAFQDEILGYMKKENSDISGFLDYMDKSGSSITLNVSEDQDAMNIMTIHKAKGLEFKVVLMPFCDWSVFPVSRGNKNTTLWPSTKDTGFDEFTNVPVVHGSLMEKSFFSREYYEESFRTYIDNLNLLYVAFTRAENELYVLSRFEDKNKKGFMCSDLLHKLYRSDIELNHDFPVISLADCFEGDKQIFEFGKKESIKGHKEKKNRVISQPLINYPVSLGMASLSLNHKNIYLSDLKEEDKYKTGYGTQMHEILAGIYTMEDIELSVRKAWIKGLLSTSGKTLLVDELRRKIQKEPCIKWFNGNFDVRNEVEIFAGDGNIIRPDRVMIKNKSIIILDYKFGTEKKNEYHKQLNNYARAFRGMGYTDIRMFLWYYKLDELEEVKYAE